MTSFSIPQQEGYVVTLTKSEITDSIAEELNVYRSDAGRILRMLLETIKSTLESGEDVLVSGFGKFCIQNKAKRRGRNPATGRAMMLKKRRIVTFRCSRHLRDRINAKRKRSKAAIR